MDKALRDYSRRKLKKALRAASGSVGDYSYNDYESELRRRDASLPTKLMTVAVVFNAVFVLADILIRLLRIGGTG